MTKILQKNKIIFKKIIETKIILKNYICKSSFQMVKLLLTTKSYAILEMKFPKS